MQLKTYNISRTVVQEKGKGRSVKFRRDEVRATPYPAEPRGSSLCKVGEVWRVISGAGGRDALNCWSAPALVF